MHTQLTIERSGFGLEQESVIICIDCKRQLPATNENFTEIKKGKHCLGNICRDCQEQRKWRGIGSKWRRRATGKYRKPVKENKNKS